MIQRVCTILWKRQGYDDFPVESKVTTAFYNKEHEFRVERVDSDILDLMMKSSINGL